MLDLAMIPLTHSTAGHVAHSALPHSPVVPDRPPGSVRLRTADTLRRLAARLDRGHQPQLGYGRPA
jgi:hypothetical protein